MCWRAGEYERELFPLPSLLFSCFGSSFPFPLPSLWVQFAVSLFFFNLPSLSLCLLQLQLFMTPTTPPFPFLLPAAFLQSIFSQLTFYLLSIVPAFLHSCIPAYMHICTSIIGNSTDKPINLWPVTQWINISHSECVHFNLSISTNFHFIFSSFLMREIKKTENSYAQHCCIASGGETKLKRRQETGWLIQ